MQQIITQLNTFSIPIQNNLIEKLETFYLELIATNQEYNLTAITEKQEVIVKHFLDSIMAAKVLHNVSSVIDIGAGAGFPSLPLALVLDKPHFTMVESIGKKVSFIQRMCNLLNLPHTTTLKIRAEDLPKEKKYDACVARGVAALNTLSEYSLPFIHSGGRLIAYKGSNYNEEIKQAKKALEVLGGEVEQIIPYTLHLKEEALQRNLIIIKKIKDTPPQYPRGGNKPRIKPI